LPAAQRSVLEKVQSFLPVPLSWLYLLPAEAKTAAGALLTLAQLPAAERLPSLFITAETPIEASNILKGPALRQTWTSAEQEVLRTALLKKGITPRPNTLANLCAAWLDLTATGEQFLQALTLYYQEFFCEEEERILPLIHLAAEQAKVLAEKVPLDELLETLSNGVHFEQAGSAQQVILIPSYWSSPLAYYNEIPPDRLLILFGARPQYHDLTPGEVLPLDLVDALKAVADPTRMRILHYLACSSLTPSGLAHRLRLRLPTVTHHLNALRLAGFVEVTVHPDGERGYTLRHDALYEKLALLIEFLTPPEL
jgi:DNA-binding transcriptional ArsR family regulator